MKNNHVVTFEDLEILEKILNEKLPPGSNGLVIFQKIIFTLRYFLELKSKYKNNLFFMKQLMGFTSKSEKAPVLEAPPLSEQSSLAHLDLADQKDIIDEMKVVEEKKRLAMNQYSQYQRKIIILRKKLLPYSYSQLEIEFTYASEKVFNSFSTRNDISTLKMGVDKMKNFLKEKGLKTTLDCTKRVDFELVLTEITCSVETVEDPVTGKRVRANMLEIGPEKFALTWKAVANLILMHYGNAIPMNRIAEIMNHTQFSTSQQCKIFQHIAEMLLPVYEVMIKQIANCPLLSGDDTNTHLLYKKSEEDKTWYDSIDRQLTWNSKKMDSEELKKTLHLSFIEGRTEKDPRSTIRFYRTHLGDLGNLFSQILVHRDTSDASLNTLMLQTDLSTCNLPASPFKILQAGCAAHARRPFYRYREADMELSYYMLRAFLVLTQIEKFIDYKGRTRENITRIRKKHASKVWNLILKHAQAGMGLRDDVSISGNKVTKWPPHTHLYKACNYIVKNFDKLTLYLTVPEFRMTNNHSERAHRNEKAFLNSSKFRVTRSGRMIADILCTILATCTAAEVNFADYLKFVGLNQFNKHYTPAMLTPYAFFKELQKSKK